MKKIKGLYIAVLAAVMLTFTACGSRAQGTQTESVAVTDEQTAENGQDASGDRASEDSTQGMPGGQLPDGQTPPDMAEGEAPSGMQPGGQMQGGAGGGAYGEYASVTEDDLTAQEDLFTDRDMSDEYEADTVITIDGGDIKVSGDGAEVSGKTVTITQEGVYEISGTAENVSIIVDAENTEKVQLVLNGVNITNSDAAAIYVLQADKVFITTADGTVNSLTLTGAITQTDDNNVDGVIFSKDDICVNGSGTLNIVSATCHGIVSKDDLKITSGTVNVTSYKKSLQANDSVRIGGGTVNLVSEKSEGIESEFIYIAGGSVNITAADDGINANESTGAIVIYGGTLNVNAGGDGLDSNGSIYQYGGDVYVSGPVNSGNGAIDYVGEAVISGGTAMIAGSSGMAMNYSSGSTQCAILYTFGSVVSGGTEVTISDEDGNVIASYTPEKQYQTIVISNDKIETDGTYTITAGNETGTVKMTGSVIYGSGSGMGGFGAQGGQGAPGMGGPGNMGGNGPQTQNNDGGFENGFQDGGRPSGIPGGGTHGSEDFGGENFGQENNSGTQQQ